MKQTLKFFALVALFAGAGMSQNALAICNAEGPYPVQQCATLAGGASWFAAKPADAGAVSASWWVLGMGNKLVADPTVGLDATANDGDGLLDVPLPGVFIGNDSGNLSVGVANGQPAGGLDLVDAAIGTGNAVGSAGGLCFSFAANWGLPYLDGCADSNRTYYYLGAGGNLSDNFLNVYWGSAPGPTVSDQRLLDPPMGALLTESNNKYFAVAFFSSTPRHGDSQAFNDSGYDMGEIVNGDPNPSSPSLNNIVPWQSIPQPDVSAAIDLNGDRILALSWPSIRIVRDNSSRPNLSTTLPDPIALRWALGVSSTGVNLTGVGVLEQPELASYAVERKPIVGTDCDANAPWVPAGPLIVPSPVLAGGSPLATSVTVPPDTCVRLTTRLGRVPFQAFRTTPVSNATRNQNRFDGQAGNLGDLGYQVSSSAKKIGGPLVGDKAVLRSATFNQKNLVVTFETLGEMAVQSFQVVAKDRRGGTTVVATVDCAQCSSGIGSDYRVEVPGTALRSAKSVYVVVQPSGTASNEIEISQATQRPETPGRGKVNR